MAEAVKRAEIDGILKKLNECRANLKVGKVHSCLTVFRDSLIKISRTNMLPQDRRAVMQDVEDFQKQLADSKSFKDIFGPVSFQEGDPETVLEFVQELINVEEENILSQIKSDSEPAPSDTGDLDPEKFGPVLMMLVEKGEMDKVQGIVAENPKLKVWMADQFNAAGIKYRKDGKFDSAIAEFLKAIAIDPQDEFLFYNLARSSYEKGDTGAAREALRAGLGINEDFHAAREFLAHIEKSRGN
jgi:tetratricopeptide (TPR) repeat protein